jgi:predicted Zn-dependent protease
LGYLAAAGYDPQGLTGYLKRLEQVGKGSQSGILATHPGIDERLENVSEAKVATVDITALPKRSKRFVDMTR